MLHVILVLKDNLVMQDYLVLMTIFVLVRLLGPARYLVYFSFFWQKESIDILGKYKALVYTYVDTWSMSLAPMIGESMWLPEK